MVADDLVARLPSEPSEGESMITLGTPPTAAGTSPYIPCVGNNIPAVSSGVEVPKDAASEPQAVRVANRLAKIRLR